MSAKRSKHGEMMRRFETQVNNYQERINNQKAIIDRLVSANAIQADALYGISEEAKTIKQAREFAVKAQHAVEQVLAVAQSEGEKA